LQASSHLDDVSFRSGGYGLVEMSSSSRVGVLALVAGLLLAAGCGGSDDETSGADEWANSVCSAVTSWTTSVTAAAQSLQGGNLSENSLESAVDDVTEATKTLADDVEDAGKPDTANGQQAKDLVEQLANDLDEGVQTIGDALDDVSGSSGILTAISQISGTLATMSSQVGDIVDELEQLDPAGELEDAINDSDECTSLRSGG
jgi:hypothetical protein